MAILELFINAITKLLKYKNAYVRNMLPIYILLNLHNLQTTKKGSCKEFKDSTHTIQFTDQKLPTDISYNISSNCK